MDRKFTTLLIVTAVVMLAAPVMAQEIAPVGQGAPRSTLIYATMDADTCSRFIGWEGESFAWQEKVFAEVSSTEERKTFEEMFGWINSLVGQSERADIAFVNFQISRQVGVKPLMYIDLTMKAGATVDLSMDWVPEFLKHGTTTLNGIQSTYIQADIGSESIIFNLFERMGHVYICMGDGVAEDLTLGLTKGPQGESLAESSRFQKWYSSRRGASVEMWFNTHEIRRLAEAAAGGETRKIYDKVDEYLNLRAWQQLTLALDYDPETWVTSVELNIEARREIPLFKKLGLPSADFALSKYVPQDTVGVGGFHLGNLNELFERTRGDINDGIKIARTGNFDDDDDESEASVDFVAKGIRKMNKAALKPFGLDFNTALGLFDGSCVAGALTPSDDPDTYGDPPLFAAFGLANRDKAIAAAEKFYTDNGEDAGIQKVDIAGYTGYVLDADVAICFTEDALLIAKLDSMMPEGNSLDILKEMVDPELQANRQEALDKAFFHVNQAAAAIGIDIAALIGAEQRKKLAESRKLSVYSEPVFDMLVDNAFPQGLGGTMSLSATDTTLTLRADVAGMQTNLLIDFMMATEGRNDRYFYGNSQLGRLHMKIMEQKIQTNQVPGSFNEMLESGLIRQAFLQSPFDPRFENSDKLNWFEEDLDDEYIAPREESQAALAAEKKGFVSYTYVAPGESGMNEEYRVLVYETEANTVGGRMVLYTGGHVGWLHDSVWEKARALIDEGKNIPTGYEEYEEEWEDPEAPDEGDSLPPEDDEEDMPGGVPSDGALPPKDEK